MKKEKVKKHFIEQPYYKGGDKALTDFIYRNLRFPQAAWEEGIEGTVFLEYDIDYQGNVVDTRIIQGLGGGCDEEAARVVRLLKFEVGKYRGVRVLFHKKAKIHFKRATAHAQPVQWESQMQVQYQVVPAAPAPDGVTENPQPSYFFQIQW